MKNIRTTLLALTLAALPAAAQQHDPTRHAAPAPAADQKSAEAAHHAFLAAERGAIERGEGFGMGMAADQAGYPGPRHILEWKEQLKLGSEQETAVRALMAQMKEKAIPLGKQILAAEERLSQMFRQGRSEAELREETNRIGALRAELRWVHLSTHLAARKLLTAEQNAAYMRLRHSDEHAQHH
jgi:Spy/CpxP family protein refolding chaperone